MDGKRVFMRCVLILCACCVVDGKRSRIEVDVEEEGCDSSGHQPEPHSPARTETPESPRHSPGDSGRSSSRLLDLSAGGCSEATDCTVSSKSPDSQSMSGDRGCRGSPQAIGHNSLMLHQSRRSPPPHPLMMSLDGARRAPLEMMNRIFPHMKRSVLQLVLQGCGGDMVQAIEQVLNNHCDQANQQSLPLIPGPPSYLSTQQLAKGASAAAAAAVGVKSAFSPITSVGSSHAAAAALRYGYPHGARGFTFMPYPPGLLPNLASMGYNYNAMAAAAVASAASQKVGGPGLQPYSNPLYCPYGAPTQDK